MVRKSMSTKNLNEQTQDVEALFELEVTAEASPVVGTEPASEVEPEPEAKPVIKAEDEANTQSDDGEIGCQDLKTLALKIAELEDKFIKLEIELSTFVEERGRGKGIKKEKKVKCKCKGKKVPLSKCKCESKKLDKI